MKYREDKYGNKLSILGLGCMRFTRDKAATEKMILAAIDGGVNYFDTAYIYPSSEVTLGEILAKNNKRKDVYINTKLPLAMCKKPDDFDKFFNEQLTRLQTDYIDYYMMHSVSSFDRWKVLCEWGIEDWIDKKKKSGQIRQIGFSYHGTYQDFIKIIDAYPWEFCMIQYNYYDEHYQAGRKGLIYAAEKGIPIMIMEPLLGGRLATGLPKQAVEIFKKADPRVSPAEWAFWWLWNQDEVTVILSGMSSLEQLQQNIHAASHYRKLKDAVYADVIELFRKAYKIPCTSCNYCLPCPIGINIPSCFSAYNTRYTQGLVTGYTQYMTSTASISQNPISPRSCNGCGKCEKICPQHISIRKELKRVSKKFEPLPVRMLMSIVRWVLGR
ncbi:MAG: aldo/keto reductase [Defluviitaleaceae bacterium]|nr:aldo/keto reductase [Defluviitaleaceae bacterium]